MSWPDDWTRGRGSRPDDPDSERTRVMPGYRPDYPDPGYRDPGYRDPGYRDQRYPDPGYDEPEYGDYEQEPEEPPGRRGRGGRTGRTSRRGGWGRRLRLTLVIVLVLILGAVIGTYFYVDSHLTKVDALADYQGRPAATPGQDYLIVGSDSREGLSAAERRELRTGSAQGRRTDTIMLLHTGDSGATLVSLPRDSYVQIPAYVDGQGRRRNAQRNKLNAAYSLGGPQLLARAVEQATDIRLDHYLEIGFGGFVGVVDSVGGVQLCLDRAIEDAKSGADLRAGCQQAGGAEALSYVRARSFDPRSDLGRVERQQQFLRALTKEIASPAVLLNPFQFVPVMNAGLDAVTVDDGSGPIDLLRLFWNMRKLSGGDGVTTTVPVADPDFRPGGGVGSAVRWDADGAEALFGALRQDSQVTQPAAR
jgi:LCP family protein required for cell wall assembly